ncbi:MAG: pantoate--beta-alanine ligase [Ginsengibacter sp.]
MIIFKYAADLKKYLAVTNYSKSPVGFVPTMGALHAGHLSLIKRSKEKSSVTVCSIFVNPVQFNNSDDFKKYPKTIEHDLLLLEENGCDILFLPDEKEMYPDEASKNKHFHLGYLETILEGKFRPGHFQGVALVVEKLLNMVEPDFLFLGQKDFQQCMVIKRLISLTHKKTEVVVCPILREQNGLAMSSRNLRLNAEEKEIASNLHRALVSIKENANNDFFFTLKNKAVKDLESKGFKVEYLELAKRNDLEIVPDFIPGEELVILVAAFLRDVRLIDNLLTNP